MKNILLSRLFAAFHIPTWATQPSVACQQMSGTLVVQNPPSRILGLEELAGDFEAKKERKLVLSDRNGLTSMYINGYLVLRFNASGDLFFRQYNNLADEDLATPYFFNRCHSTNLARARDDAFVEGVYEMAKEVEEMGNRGRRGVGYIQSHGDDYISCALTRLRALGIRCGYSVLDLSLDR